jgi:hypothetical protein
MTMPCSAHVPAAHAVDQGVSRKRFLPLPVMASSTRASLERLVRLLLLEQLVVVA